MLKIKLSRVGKRNQPAYRVVVQEARTKLGGKVVDRLGYYHPLDDPAAVKIDKKRYQDWIAKGAQPTATVKCLYRKA